MRKEVLGMRIGIRKILAVLLVVMMVLLLTSCGQKPDVPRVYYLSQGAELDLPLREIAKKYSEKTGVQVRIETAATDAYSDVLTSEMKKDNDAPTMFLLTSDNAVNALKDSCYDLRDSEVAKSVVDDAFLKYDDEGKLCGISHSYEAYGIIVNTALLEQAGYERDYINSFATLSQVATDVHNRASELGFDAFTSLSMDSLSSLRVTEHLMGIDYFYEYRDNPEAWRKAPASITGKYMPNVRKLYELMVTNSLADRATLGSGGFDANEEFATGKALFYLNGSWEWQKLSERSVKSEDVSMLPYYCSVAGEANAGLSSLISTQWAVNKNVPQSDIDATLAFMSYLVNDMEASQIAVAALGAMPFKQAAKTTNPFLTAANDYFASGKYSMLSLSQYQPNPDNYRAKIVHALNEYNSDPTDEKWAEVEAAAVKGWEEEYKGGV